MTGPNGRGLGACRGTDGGCPQRMGRAGQVPKVTGQVPKVTRARSH